MPTIDHDEVLPLRGAPFPPGTRLHGSLTFDGSLAGNGVKTTVSFNTADGAGTNTHRAIACLELLVRALRGEAVDLPDDRELRAKRAADEGKGPEGKEGPEAKIMGLLGKNPPLYKLIPGD